MMKNIKNWKEQEDFDKQELLGQKEYLEMINEANIKRIANLLEMDKSVRSNSIEKTEQIAHLRLKLKKRKRKFKNKLQKKELEYIRQIHLLKSELYDRIIAENTGSEELRKIIEISEYTRIS